MNKLLNNLFEKDSVIKIISILIAILIWFLVLDSENPIEERTLTVPLSSNEEILEDRNLQIVNTIIPANIDVKIKGRRDKITAVTSNDFKAVLDFSDVIESGIKRIKIEMPEYTGDENIYITSINPQYINVKLERIVGKQYPVNIEFKGSLPAGYELVNVRVDPANVILEERESNITKVSKVVANVNTDNVLDKNEVMVYGIVLDANGKQIKQFDGKIPLVVTYNLAKRVPVIATTTGEPAKDYFLKTINYTLPEVRLTGSYDVLKGISKITAQPIDISEKSSSFEVPLSIELPKGTTLLPDDSDRLIVEVVLERFGTRTFNLPSSIITIYESDTSGAREYRVSDEIINITVRGKPDVINNITAGDFRLSVNVKDLGPGQHTVPLLVQLPRNVSLVGEYSVNVIIESTPVEPTPTGEPLE
jgi:YbbR domain-containing protein